MHARRRAVAGVTIFGIIVLASVGALRVRNAGDEVQITIDKEEVKTRTEQAVDKTKHLGERGAETPREIFASSQADEDTTPSDPQANSRRLDPSTEPSGDHEEPSGNERANEER
ncbi:MAG: hypothetical protein EA424_15755 [Planctomycetaceae bacterium]|nr:MAG: hypothetical protein EA424_15755 [Planctomycetaceae bacterium]